MLELIKYCLMCFLMLFSIASGHNPEGATLGSILVGFATGVVLFGLLLLLLFLIGLIMKGIYRKGASQEPTLDRPAKEKKGEAPSNTPAGISRYPDGNVTFCPHLRPLYQAETERGNSIVYINLNEGSKHVKVVYLAKALQTYDSLDESVKQGTYTDYHFPFEKYYHCDKCRWTITGPLENGQKNWYRPDAKEIVAPEDIVPPRVELLSDGRWRREACFANVINPRVIATPEDIVFEDGWQQFTYSDDWQILPTIK